MWAAVPTPFLADGRLDLAGLRRNARHFVDHLGLDGIYCNGLMGEGFSLDVSERRAALDAILDAVGGRAAVGVVVTHHSHAETLLLARHAERAGAHHVVLARPRAPLSDAELHDHVVAIAEAISRPVVLFESGAPGLGFGMAVTVRLATEGAIIAVKAANEVRAAARLRKACGDRILVIDPREENWLTNMRRFGQSALYADPEPYLYQTSESQPIRAYGAAFERNEPVEAQRISAALAPLRRVYNRWILRPLEKGIAPNAALKAWCELIGLAGGPVRPPLRPLTEKRRLALEADIRLAMGSGDRSPSRSLSEVGIALP
jgi:4-hydroxy-tetrahydrodipicolinate synthase